MDLALLVYVISLLKGIGTFCLVILGLCAVVMVCNFFYWVDGYGNDRTPGCVSRAWKAFWVAVVCFWALILLPSERTAYTMVGAYAAQKVSENEKVQQMSGKVLTIIEQKLDSYIDEGLEKAKETVVEKVSK